MRKWTKEQALEAIRARIIINEQTDCHEYQGSKTRDGYGQVSLSGLYEAFGIKLVHRLVYSLANEFEFTSRHEQVMHQCHNRSCCNPAHLKVGTAKANMRQAVERGSYANVPKGEDHPGAKLTNNDVRGIKILMRFGFKNQFINHVFPAANTNTLSAIRHERIWRSVTI